MMLTLSSQSETGCSKKDNEIVLLILNPAQGTWAGNHCISVFFSFPFLLQETNADYQTVVHPCNTSRQKFMS